MGLRWSPCAMVVVHGLTARARMVASAVAGADPVIMLMAPSPASERCLPRAGIRADDISLWEIDKAFAAVPLETRREVNDDPERVNINRGAVALGHLVRAGGAMLMGAALDELERSERSTAIITMCTGGGMATATIIERV